jgi:hypothetical protein
MERIQVGDKVLVTINSGFIQLENVEGTIVHIDERHLFDHWTYPIQVEFPNAYDDSGQTVLRCSLKEVRPT